MSLQVKTAELPHKWGWHFAWLPRRVGGRWVWWRSFQVRRVDVWIIGKTESMYDHHYYEERL